jgi:hypothetical protein
VGGRDDGHGVVLLCVIDPGPTPSLVVVLGWLLDG